MLELSPKTRLSWDFTVLRDGRPVAHLDLSGWHAREHLTVEGKPYRAYRDGMSRHHVLESDGVIFAHADKHEDARRRYTVEHAGTRYVLRGPRAMGRTFFLMDGSRKVGTVSRNGLFTHHARVDVPETLPLPVAVFLIWLVVIEWQGEKGPS